MAGGGGAILRGLNGWFGGGSTVVKTCCSKGVERYCVSWRINAVRRIRFPPLVRMLSLLSFVQLVIRFCYR